MAISYDTKFLTAVARVLRHEGGYVNDPNDPGGVTNFGISLRWASTLHPEMKDFTELDVDGDGIIEPEEIKNMSKDDAIALYYDYWWSAPSNNYGSINDPMLAGKVFDIAVNVGNLRANKRLQTVASIIPIDGIIGPHSLNVINTANPQILINKFIDSMIAYYESIPNNSRYIKGWIARVTDLS
jgi:lysozyme family protein